MKTIRKKKLFLNILNKILISYISFSLKISLHTAWLLHKVDKKKTNKQTKKRFDLRPAETATFFNTHALPCGQSHSVIHFHLFHPNPSFKSYSAIRKRKIKQSLLRMLWGLPVRGGEKHLRRPPSSCVAWSGGRSHVYPLEQVAEDSGTNAPP